MAKGAVSRSSSEVSQESCPPRLRAAQPYARSLACDAVLLARAAGVELLPWQVAMLEDWAAVGPDGKFVHTRCGASVPRQAGKSMTLEAWVLYLTVVMGLTVLWTEHNYSTTCEMVRRFRRIFGQRPNDPRAERRDFNALVKSASNKTAQENFFLKNGGSVHFTTRTKSTNLGFSFDVVIYDEAQLLTDEQQQAILPTTSSGAGKNPQTIYTGTPPHPGGPGEIFEQLRDEAHGQAEADLCWMEWGVDEVGDVRDESRWFLVNPSLSPGLANITAIRMARPPSMSQLAFAQDYLGYWLPKAGREQAAVMPEDWAALAESDPPREGGRVSYAFKFAPDGSTVALAACRRPDIGLPHIEVVAYRSLAHGAGWCADFAEERKAEAACFVVDGGGNARALRDELLRRRVPKRAVVEPAAKDVAAACSQLITGVADGAFTHFAQPALDSCMASVKKRQIGRTGFGFEGIGGTDPSMAEAAALALWGAYSVKRDPRRKGRAGC